MQSSPLICRQFCCRFTRGQSTTMRNARSWRKLLVGCLVSLLLPTVYYKLNGNRWRTANGEMMHRDVVHLDPVDPDPDGLDPAIEPTPVEISTFEGFNNETGTDSFIVPNIIHYIRFNKATFSFVDYVCVRSAYVNHRPQRIFFHTNVIFLFSDSNFQPNNPG